MKMSISKKQRVEIWNKSNGKCWYCGNDLPEKGWHADHFKPVIRMSSIVPNKSGSHFSHRIVSTGEMQRAENHNIDNLVPACAPCNLFKSTFGIEFFRKEIEAQVERARRSSVNFRTAERFGLLQVIDCSVVFWFERNRKDCDFLQYESREADERH